MDFVRKSSETCAEFLAASPPGQFAAMASALQSIAPAAASNAMVEAAAADYSSKHPRLVVVGESNLIVCAAAMVDANHFYDPTTNLTYTINHVTMEAAPSPSVHAPAKSPHENYRAAIAKSLEEYKAMRFFKNSASAVYARDGHIYVCLVVENINQKNMWGGSWVSLWSVDIKSSVLLKGVIHIHAHYYEDVNTQLRTSKKIGETSFPKGAEAVVAASIVDTIRASESELHAGLDRMYENMNDETFRAMRRTLPITRTKMEWNMNSLRMNKMVTRPGMVPVMLPGMRK